MKKVSLLSIIALVGCLYSCNFKSNNSTDDTTADTVAVKEVVIKES